MHNLCIGSLFSPHVSDIHICSSCYCTSQLAMEKVPESLAKSNEGGVALGLDYKLYQVGPHEKQLLW